VSPQSAFGNEQEVLFDAGSCFFVEGVRREGSVTIINLIDTEAIAACCTPLQDSEWKDLVAMAIPPGVTAPPDLWKSLKA
jgi:hypothetical protein